MKVHFRLSAEPLPEGKQYFMECGAKVKNSKFVMSLQPGDQFPETASTLMFCTACLKESLNRTDFREHYCYGCVEGENSRHEGAE